MLYRSNDAGLFEIITSGSMFAGKTRTLLTKLEIFQLAGKEVVLLTPKEAHNRYSVKNFVVAHNGQRMPAIEVESATEILNLKNYADVIGIDEIMLFQEKNIIDAVEELTKSGHIVVASGLSLLSSGEPFNHMPELLAMADIITQVYGVCHECGNPSVRTWPRFDKNTDIVIGKDYLALCKKCWYKYKFS